MSRFVLGVFAVGLLALAGRLAAPVPKDEMDEAPDLKEFFDGVGKAIKDEKWPAASDEKKLTDVPQQVFDRALKAAELKGRPLPVGFAQLKKVGPFKQKFEANSFRDSFVIAESVQINGADGSVVFATGVVDVNGATNCVIVGGTVNCTSCDNCLIVANELVAVTGARFSEAGKESVLVAGKWLRVTGAIGAVCHVAHPGNEKCPLDRLTNPIYIGRADDVIFLNTAKEWQATRDTNCKSIAPKAPIAK